MLQVLVSRTDGCVASLVAYMKKVNAIPDQLDDSCVSQAVQLLVIGPTQCCAHLNPMAIEDVSSNLGVRRSEKASYEPCSLGHGLIPLGF